MSTSSPLTTVTVSPAMSLRCGFARPSSSASGVAKTSAETTGRSSAPGSQSGMSTLSDAIGMKPL